MVGSLEKARKHFVCGLFAFMVFCELSTLLTNIRPITHFILRKVWAKSVCRFSLLLMREWYKYELWNRRILVYVGITNDILRSEYEDNSFREYTRMKIIGRATTREAAVKWKEARIETYRKNHQWQYPPFNDPRGGTPD
jgi:hypothetical protein